MRARRVAALAFLFGPIEGVRTASGSNRIDQITVLSNYDLLNASSVVDPVATARGSDPLQEVHLCSPRGTLPLSQTER